MERMVQTELMEKTEKMGNNDLDDLNERNEIK